MDPASPGERPMISRREWRFVWLIIVAVLVLTSLPYLYGRLSSPPDKQFMGLMLDVPDHGQYLSWWRGFQSSLLTSNKLTPEPNEPMFFNLLWWALAQVSRWTGLGYAPVYQVFRWVAGGSFLWAAYRLIAHFLPETRQRRTAFLLVTFSSGLGWVLVVLKHTFTEGELLFPLDLYVAEGNSFLCILGYPHFAFAAAFIALSLEWIWRGWKEQRAKHMVVAGMIALLLGWQHAYDLLIVYGVMGTFALLVWWKRRAFPWRLFWGGVIVFALSCSGAVYSVILTTIDPLWEEVLAQFANCGVYTPSPPHLVILFGFPLILAVMTAVGLHWRKRRQRRDRWSEEDLFVVGWFLTGAALNYIPTDFQIHMLNSWQIPMMILVTWGLYDFVCPAIAGWRPAAGEKAVRWMIVAFLVAVLPTNIYLWTWRFVDLARHDSPFYLYRDDVAALEWLRQNTRPDDVVLCSLTVGQYVPAISGNTAFLAHWAQTVGFYDKRERVARFFDAATPDEERAETLRSFGVDYVFHGPAERELGAYDPASALWLTPAFSAETVDVYRVDGDRLPVAVGSGGIP
jgi:hypothetical protein